MTMKMRIIATEAAVAVFFVNAAVCKSPVRSGRKCNTTTRNGKREQGHVAAHIDRRIYKN